MFTRLRIQNFKAWKDSGHIRLAPLTVFFGTNSSGKTSFHQLLLMLKQTAQSRDRRRVLHFGDADSLVDLGVWPEMVFNHDPAATLGFDVEWTHQLDWNQLLNEKGYKNSISPVASFRAAIGSAREPSGSLFVKEFEYRYRFQSKPDLWVPVGMRRSERQGEVGYDLVTSHDMFPRRSSREESLLPPPVHFHRFPDEIELLYQRTDLIYDLVYDFEQKLNSLEYLGPLRRKPSRSYSWSGEAPEWVGEEGERTVAALLAAQERSITVETQGAVPFLGMVAGHLRRMGLLEAFEARLVAPHRKEYELLVRTPGSNRDVSLVDVGFGVSQVLPVLVQCFYAEPGSTLIFEQPELHLHPRAQSELGDLFVETLQSREAGKPRDIQLLIESHSEHLLRRIQRHIAEGKLKREDAALYFCSPGPDGSRIEELRLDEDGNITNWPENFFGDEMGDLVAMTEAAMKRQLEHGQE
jgi:predicted ATPase